MTNDLLHPKVLLFLFGALALTIAIADLMFLDVSPEFEIIMFTVIGMFMIIWGSIVQIRGE